MLTNRNKALVTILVLVSLFAGCKADPKAVRDKYYKSGQKYMDSKKYEEAAIEFRNAIRAEANHVSSYLGIAKAFQQLGNHQDAIAAFQQVIKLDSKNIEARLRLGEYQIAAGISNSTVFKQAQESAEAVLKAEPNNVEGLILLGNAYAGQNETDKSIQQYEKALSLDAVNLKATLNSAAAYFRKKDVPKAQELFEKALKDHPNDIQARISAATFYAAIQRPQDAENQLKKAFDIAPADSRSLNTLASFYMSANKTAEAENVFKTAIARNPKAREPRWGLANFYLQQKRLDEGIQTINDFLKINPKDRAAQLLLADIYVGRNNDGKAQEYLTNLLADNKNDAQANFLQGKIFRRQQKFDKALADFDIAIKGDASLLPAYLEKANLELMKGDLDASEKTLKAALQRNKNYLPARGALAKLQALRQKPQDALQMAEEVLAAMPNNEDALGARAEALRLTGRLDESLKDWTRLCEMQPANATYRHRLGLVEVMQGKNAAAMADFRKALELKPELKEAINDLLFIHLQAKQYDAALAELDRLAKSSAPQDEIHRFRGQVYLAQGNQAAAESEWRQTIAINPQNFATYILLGQLKLQQNQLPQAIQEVDKLIAKNNKFVPAYLLKAFYLQMAKDNQGAITNYRKTLELDSGNAIAANNLAWILCESNVSLEEALSLAKTAKKKMAEDPEVAETLGWTYYKMKNYTLATDQLLFSINNRKKPSAENYYRLGMALYAKGDLAQAKQTLRKSLGMDSKFPGADEARRLLKVVG